MKYRTIVVDPPWPYDEGWPIGFGSDSRARRTLPYRSMTVEQIAAVPVRSLIALEGYLFLWTTNRHLESAFTVLRTWTLRPCQVLVWCKEPIGIGTGGLFATNVEFVIVAQRVGPKSHARKGHARGGRIPTSWFQWKRGKHSEKPEQLQDLIEQTLDGPYLELFARRQRLGWHVWGNEVVSDIELEVAV